MNKLVQGLYLNSPAWAKNLLVSTYGVRIYNERYSRCAKEYDKLLSDTQFLDAVSIKRFQEKSFIDLARNAIKDVPYYQNWAHDNGIKEEDIKSIEDLDRFPILEKTMLQRDPSQFVSRKYRFNNLIKLSTSGSTGSPISIYTDKTCRTFHYSFFSRLRKWYGVNKRDRRATFFGRVVVESERCKPPFWVYDAVQNNLIMSVFHISPENLKYYYIKLKSFQPKEIFGHPSTIYQISRYIIENRLQPIKVKMIMTTAETLMPFQREAIFEAFQCVLVNQYGCTEMAFFGSENSEMKMVMHPEHAILEVLDDSGSLVQQGEGDLIATGLVNSVMPLIRYRMGDRVSKLGEFDSVHPGFEVLNSLEGRTDDAIYTRDGRIIGRLSPIFRSDKCILSSQVVQEIDGTINIYVVPADGYNRSHRELIQSAAKQRIGSSVAINVVEVNNIDTEKNGKFRPVKSYYKGVPH